MKKVKLILNIEANKGYSADQVGDRHCFTVGDLRRILDDYDDETPIITQDENNRYGASWGEVNSTDEWEPESWYADIVIKDKATGETVKTIEDVEVYECGSTEEEEDLMRELGVEEEFFDKDTYDIDWEEK